MPPPATPAHFERHRLSGPGDVHDDPAVKGPPADRLTGDNDPVRRPEPPPIDNDHAFPGAFDDRADLLPDQRRRLVEVASHVRARGRVAS